MFDEESRLEALAADSGVRVARIALWAMGSIYALAAMLGGPWAGVSIVAAPGADPAVTDLVGGIVAIAVILVGLGVGLAHFLSAWALGDGRRWAWVLTLVLGALALLQCCLPVGGALLWAMLNDRTRALFAAPPSRA